jgi:hypothetical protein
MVIGGGVFLLIFKAFCVLKTSINEIFKAACHLLETMDYCNVKLLAVIFQVVGFKWRVKSK